MKKILPIIFALIGLNSFAQSKSNINLLHNWKNPAIPGSIIYNNAYNEVWGFVQNNKEYAVIGSTWGTHIFDVTDPQNIIQVDSVKGGESSAIVIHRDYHDYNGYLYMVCDEGNNSTLQIADLQYLPDSVHVVYDSKVLINKAHNIFIDSATAKLYGLSVKKGNGTNAALSIYSLANPANPVHLADWNAVGHVHDAYIINDTAFCNAGPQGLWIMDFTTPATPQVLGTLTTYPDQGYNHSGWLSEDRTTYVFTDENHGLKLKVCDATDLSDLSIESFLFSGVSSNSMAHNIIIKDKIAYVSYYHDGLYLFNISDMQNPQVLGWYDTYLPSDHDSYRGAWGVYPFLPSGNILVSDMQSGLFVFEEGTTLGMEKAFKNEIAIFPNPVNTFFHMQLPGELLNKDVILQIYDLTGKLILSENQNYTSSINTIEMPATAAGVYLIKVTAGDLIYTKKINKISR